MKCTYDMELRRMNTVTGEATLEHCFCFPSEKGVYPKRKEFAPPGSKFFYFRVDPFKKRD